MGFPLFRRWQDAVYAGLIGAWAIAFVWTEWRHNLTFPIPWPDEGSFLWPALAFSENSTLYAPELNPAREVFWMPPGFMVIEGFVFKLVSFSLMTARLLSTLYLTLAFACLLVQVRPSRARFGHALLVAVLSFAPIFQLVGNTARMESLVLLVATSGFLLLDRGSLVGLALLAAGPLVHPNGAFALAGGIVYFLFAFRGRRKPSRAAAVAFAVVALCWALFALHIALHWAAFVDDMTTQLRWKQSEAALNGTLLGRLFDPFRVVAIVVLSAAFVLATRVGARVGAIAALGLSLLLGSGFTVGWLYEVYPAFGTLLSGMVILELASAWVAGLAPGRALFATGAAAALLSGGALAIREHRFLTESVRRATLPASPGAVYCTSEEHRLVENFIKSSIRKSGPINVQFLPDSDSLLFHDLRSPSVRMISQMFLSTRPDVFILHDSPWFPEFLRNVELADFAFRNEVNRPLERWQTVAYDVRGGRWIAVRRDGPGLPWN